MVISDNSYKFEEATETTWYAVAIAAETAEARCEYEYVHVRALERSAPKVM